MTAAGAGEGTHPVPSPRVLPKIRQVVDIHDEDVQHLEFRALHPGMTEAHPDYVELFEEWRDEWLADRENEARHALAIDAAEYDKAAGW